MNTNRFARAAETRTAAIDPVKLGEYICEMIGTPMPTWTGLLNDCPDKDPPFDPKMRCVSVRRPWRFWLPDGKIEVELRYEEMEE